MPRVQIIREPLSAGLFVILALSLPIALQAQVGGRNFVQLEISSQTDGPLGQNQKWLETLADVGADSVRMVQTAGSSRPGVKKTKTGGADGSASYKIIGVINHRNELILPGGKYSIRDTERIKAYIDSIRADGAEVALAEKLAFGLTAEQLVDIHTHLTP